MVQFAIQKDLLGKLGSLNNDNPYCFALNNPIIFWDNLGLNIVEGFFNWWYDNDTEGYSVEYGDDILESYQQWQGGIDPCCAWKCIKDYSIIPGEDDDIPTTLSQLWQQYMTLYVCAQCFISGGTDFLSCAGCTAITSYHIGIMMSCFIICKR